MENRALTPDELRVMFDTVDRVKAERNETAFSRAISYLGWQGGTIHQVEGELHSRKAKAQLEIMRIDGLLQELQ